MNILVTNDDGVTAVGIHRLALALKEGGHGVFVCAPAQQQSATGHGITIGRAVRMEPVPAADFVEAAEAFAMDGTPADCVKFGLELFENRGVKIDAVFSGFNHGMNLGTDTLYSGTVSAAVEGALCGMPAAALSISSNFAFHKEPTHFSYAMRMAQAVARSMSGAHADSKFGYNQKKKAPSTPTPEDVFAPSESEVGLGLDYIYRDHTILNVNVPDAPEEEIRGVKAVPLSYREYEEWFDVELDAEGKPYYRYSGRPKIVGEADADGSDIVANRLGYATVTPLHFDLTNHRQLEAARREWGGIII
ncbi:MAG: 5'/3'-nucleotidase SurE [Clostridiales Family XIII bacterium]|jgi:5'-nucleotidase|nr:5'/3'-nucleotidase SurE [Clostridiales Family XIII bacterium]